MTDPYVTLTELRGRLDWDMDDDEQRIAQSALEDLSDDARGYGLEWTAETLPRQVRTTILRAATRYMRNPDGYVQSRAGDETVIWSDTKRPGGAAEFTAEEIVLIKDLAGKNAGGYFGTVPMTAWGPMRPARRYGPEGTYFEVPGLVPTETGPFPMFESPDPNDDTFRTCGVPE